MKKYSPEGQINKFIADSIGTTVRNISDNPMKDLQIKNKISGRNNYKWKGGRKESDGYIFIYKPEHPFADTKGYVKEHRLVMEEHLGRYLKPEEVIHHINWDTKDNKIENLHLFESKSKHTYHHHQLRNIVRESLGIKRNKGWI